MDEQQNIYSGNGVARQEESEQHSSADAGHVGSVDMEEYAPNPDANLVVSLLVALVLTAAVFVLCWPWRGSPIGKYLYNLQNTTTAWVPPAEVFLALWSVCILFSKWRKYRWQARTLRKVALPTEPFDISPPNTSQFIGWMHELDPSYGRSFLVRRILRALNHFRVRQNREEVATLLTAQSEIDAAFVSSSYTMLRVFIWALPILGFIGTVLGIGGAVDGFSGLSSLEHLQSALSVISVNLASAFGTTLVALVLSLLVMLPTSAMEKAEQDMMTRIDEYCNDHLLCRLRETLTATTDDDAFERIGQRMTTAMLQTLEQEGAAVGRAIASPFLQLVRKHAAVLVKGFVESMDNARQMLIQVNNSVQGTATEVTAAARDLQQTIATVAGLPAQVQAQIQVMTEQVNASQGEFQAVLSQFCAGLHETVRQQQASAAALQLSLAESQERYAARLQETISTEIATMTQGLAQTVAEFSALQTQFQTQVDTTRALADSIHERLQTNLTGVCTHLEEAMKQQQGSMTAQQESMTQHQQQFMVCMRQMVETLEASQELMRKSADTLQRAVVSQEGTVEKFEMHNDLNVLRAVLTGWLNTSRLKVAGDDSGDGEREKLSLGS